MVFAISLAHVELCFCHEPHADIVLVLVVLLLSSIRMCKLRPDLCLLFEACLL